MQSKCFLVRIKICSQFFKIKGNQDQYHLANLKFSFEKKN